MKWVAMKPVAAKSAATTWIACIVCGLATAQAYAQAPAGETPRRERAPLAAPEDLEPAVDVGRTQLAIAPRASGGAPAVPREREDLVDAPPADVVGSRAGSGPGASATRPRAMDSIDLGTTSITGNQELPKVLSIVPWKKSGLGDPVGRPASTLLDEVLAPVDPEVFERHLDYYETLHSQGQEE